MNVVECYLDAYEQIYIHFAKYELFLNYSNCLTQVHYYLQECW